MPQSPDAPCLSCGAPQPERFCARCGEKRISQHDLSIGHFFEETFEHLTHLDLRSLRTLKTLVFRPGQLTRDYLEGRRKGSLGPVQLFVMINVVFALLVGFTPVVTFNTPLSVQLTNPPFAAMKTQMVADAVEHQGITREEFSRRFNATATSQSKTWIFSLIPAFAAVLALLYRFRRYYFHYLVFAIHFYSVFLLLLVSWGFVNRLMLPYLAAARLSSRELIFTVETLGSSFAYLVLALRRVYGDSLLSASLRAVALAVAEVLLLIFFYRFLLFFVVLRTMH